MKTENKHTPGPWEISKNNYSDNRFGILMQGNYRAFVVPYGQNATDEDKANAKLIVAAPELLEALELAQEILLHADNATMVDMEKIDRAIGKAK